MQRGRHDRRLLAAVWHRCRSLAPGYNALPCYSEIVGAFAAALVIVGAVSVVVLITWLGKWRYLWSEWFTSLDHKKIGIMYIVLAFVMLRAR